VWRYHEFFIVQHGKIIKPEIVSLRDLKSDTYLEINLDKKSSRLKY